MAVEVGHGGKRLQRPGNTTELPGVQLEELAPLGGRESLAARQGGSRAAVHGFHEAVDVQPINGVQHTRREEMVQRCGTSGGQIIADPCEAGHPHSITEICSLQACGKPSAPARGRCGDIVGNEP